MAKVLVRLAEKLVPEVTGLDVVMHPAKEVLLEDGQKVKTARRFGVDPKVNLLARDPQKNQHFFADEALSEQQQRALADIFDTLGAYKLSRMTAGPGFALVDEETADEAVELVKGRVKPDA